MHACMHACIYTYPNTYVYDACMHTNLCSRMYVSFQVVHIQGASHCAHDDAPGDVTAHLQSFLAGISQAE